MSVHSVITYGFGNYGQSTLVPTYGFGDFEPIDVFPHIDLEVDLSLGRSFSCNMHITQSLEFLIKK